MFYTSVELVGFGSHKKKTTFNFNEGVTLINGGNGSGKTTIIDAIQWGLFGPRGSSRSLSKDRTSVINDKSQSAKVTLSLVSEDGYTITITRALTRSGKHTLLTVVDGTVFEGITEGQKMIEGLLFNIDSDLFSASSMIISSPSLESNKFISAKPIDRRIILAKLVDPAGNFSLTNKVVKKRIKMERDALKTLEGKREGLVSVLSSQEKPEVYPHSLNELKLEENNISSQLSSLGGSHDEEELVKKMGSLKKDLESIGRTILNINSDIQSVDEEISDNLKKRDTLALDVSRSLSSLDSINDDIYWSQSEIEACSDMTQYYKEVEERILKDDEGERSLKDAIKTVREKSIEFGKCLICGSEHIINDAHDDVNVMGNGYDRGSVSSTLRELSQRMESLVEKNQKLLREQLKVQSSVDSLEDSLNNVVSRRLKKLKAEKRELLEELEDTIQEQDDIQSRLNNLIQNNNTELLINVDELKKELSSVREKIIECSTAQREHELYESRVQELEEKLSEINYDLSVKESIISQMKTLDYQTSPNGVISEKISEISEKVSEKSNDIYSRAFGYSCNISVESDTEDGEPTCMIFANNRDIATYSHGEQSRMIAAILLAVSLSVKEHLGIWIPLLWDEPESSVDEMHHQSIMSMIKNSLDEGEQAIVISRHITNNAHQIINV